MTECWLRQQQLHRAAGSRVLCSAQLQLAGFCLFGQGFALVLHTRPGPVREGSALLPGGAASMKPNTAASFA